MISKIITAYQSYGLDILLKACVFLCDDIDSGKKPIPCQDMHQAQWQGALRDRLVDRPLNRCAWVEAAIEYLNRKLTLSKPSPPTRAGA